MKTPKYYMMMVAVLAALTSVGCGNKKDDGAPIRQANRVGGQYGQMGQLNQGDYYQTATGQVTANSDVDTQVRSFLSPLMDVNNNQIGNVDPYSGITFTGMVRLSQCQGQMNGQYGILIKIKDSYEIQNPQNPLQPAWIPVQSCNADRNTGRVSITFGDAQGQVIMDGQYDVNNTNIQYSQFQGSLRFRNNNGSQGTLGQFRINTCGFIICSTY